MCGITLIISDIILIRNIFHYFVKDKYMMYYLCAQALALPSHIKIQTCRYKGVYLLLKVLSVHYCRLDEKGGVRSKRLL